MENLLFDSKEEKEKTAMYAERYGISTEEALARRRWIRRSLRDPRLQNGNLFAYRQGGTKSPVKLAMVCNHLQGTSKSRPRLDHVWVVFFNQNTQKFDKKPTCVHTADLLEPARLQWNCARQKIIFTYKSWFEEKEPEYINLPYESPLGEKQQTVSLPLPFRFQQGIHKWQRQGAS